MVGRLFTIPHNFADAVLNKCCPCKDFPTMFTNIGDIKLQYLHFDTSKNSEYQTTSSRNYIIFLGEMEHGFSNYVYPHKTDPSMI